MNSNHEPLLEWLPVVCKVQYNTGGNDHRRNDGRIPGHGGDPLWELSHFAERKGSKISGG